MRRRKKRKRRWRSGRGRGGREEGRRKEGRKEGRWRGKRSEGRDRRKRRRQVCVATGTSGVKGVGQDSVPQLAHRKHGHRGLSDRGQCGSMEAERALEAMVEI